VRRHTEEVAACVFVVSKGMRSTCAECRSLCLQRLEHLWGELYDDIEGFQSVWESVEGFGWC
jgi:hypothetical protein